MRQNHLIVLLTPLMAMPNVGKDSDFERVQNESTPDVFT